MIQNSINKKVYTLTQFASLVGSKQPEKDSIIEGRNLISVRAEKERRIYYFFKNKLLKHYNKYYTQVFFLS